jgi:hypothetical protein
MTFHDKGPYNIAHLWRVPASVLKKHPAIRFVVVEEWIAEDFADSPSSFIHTQFIHYGHINTK